MIVVTWIYFLCTIARLRCGKSQRVKDPPCSSSSIPALPEVQPVLSGSTSLLSTDSVVGPLNPGIPEDQYSLKVQFLVLVATQFVFLFLWCCGAMAMWNIDKERKLFSCLYGGIAAGLGIFLVLHHCFKRLDVQAAWLGCCRGYHSQPIQVYNHNCTSTVGVQSTPERGSQLFGCSPPVEQSNYSSSRSSSSPSGTGSVGTGPCKLTNLLQVTQDNANNASCALAGANTNTSTSTENTTNKSANNLLPSFSTTFPTQQHQRKKISAGRTKASGQYHHRGEGRAHYRLKALRAGVGSVGALGPPGSDQVNIHHPHRYASSENGSLRNGHTDVQNGLLTNGRHRPEGPVTSPSEGSDGGSSGSRKPFTLLPSIASRVATQQNGQRHSASRDNLKPNTAPDRDFKRGSFPIITGIVGGMGVSNTSQNGMLKGSVIKLDSSGSDQSRGSVGMRPGVWKSETTV